MLQVKNLTKYYGAKCAVQNLSFFVGQDEIVGFLGPNGAGKSTTLNMITGYLASSEGEIYIDGINVLEQPCEAKRRVGYLPEKPPLYPEMTVGAYLNFVCEAKQVCLPRKSHLAEICRMVQIDAVFHRVIRNLSKGYQQRVGIAQALIGYPSLLLLDEPTVGLDPKQMIEIRALLTDLAKKHTIILSSHLLSEVQSICSRVLVLNEGMLVADDTPDHLGQSLYSGNRITVSVQAQEDTAYEVLCALASVTAVSRGAQTESGIWEFSVAVQAGCDIRSQLFWQLAKHNMPIMALSGARTDLEAIFLSLTSATHGGAPITANQSAKEASPQ